MTIAFAITKYSMISFAAVLTLCIAFSIVCNLVMPVA